MNEFDIYNQIINTLKYRQYIINYYGDNVQFTNVESLLNKVNQEFPIIEINGMIRKNLIKDKLDKFVIYLFINQPSDTKLTKKKFMELLKNRLNSSKIRINELENFILIKEPKIKKNDISYTQCAWKDSYIKDLTNDPIFSSVYFEFYDYRRFIINIVKHVSYNKHEILDIDGNEYKKLINYCNVDNINLKHINRDDVYVVLIGARPGQIIKIYLSSQFTGQSVSYRQVTNNLMIDQ